MWNQINSLSPEKLRLHLARCCGASRWVEGMVAARPFISLENLFMRAGNLWWELEPSDWLEAFRHHPKIGDVEHLRRRFAATADLSGFEQAGVQGADEAVIQALAEGNADYELKFGHIFIVCATGKSAAEMLAILQSRLPNNPDVELPLAAEQQRQITFLRLAKWLEEAPEVGQRVVLTALQRVEDGRVAWQLRDDKPEIVWPNSWALFGGTIEEGEEPAEAAVREVAEELTIALDPAQLRFGRTHFSVGELGFKVIWLYHYPITHEMDFAILEEGQRYDWHTVAETAAELVQGHAVASHHRCLMEWLVRDGGKGAGAKESKILTS